MDYTLVSPQSSEAWRAYHGIRQRVLREGGGRPAEDQADQPDKHRPNRFPKLLLLDGEPVGVIRIDIDGAVAHFRHVAIVPACQRQGHGRVLLQLAERFARGRCAGRVEIEVDREAAEFFRRCGFAARGGESGLVVVKTLQVSEARGQTRPSA